MATVDQATFETNVDTAAAALTTALSDTVLTEMAKELRNPAHPLRDLSKLFLIDKTTGVVTTNTAYTGAFFVDGRKTQIGTQPRKLIADIALAAILGAAVTVTDADPLTVFIATSENVYASNRNPITPGDFVVAGGTYTGLVTAVVINGSVIELTMDTAWLTTETGTLTYTATSPEIITSRGAKLADFAVAVTNTTT